MKARFINFRVENELRRRLENLAREDERTLSDMARIVFKAGFKEAEKMVRERTRSKKMAILNLLNTVFILSCLAVGCGRTSDVTVPDPSNPAANTQTPDADNEDPADDSASSSSSSSSGGSSGSASFQLTYYAFTKTIATWTTSGVTHTLQGTGTCVTYNATTYCWDDGTKVSISPNVRVQYWGLDNTFSTCPNFSGQCSSDMMLAPRIMSANVVAKLNTLIGSAHRTVAEVFASGTAAQATCTEAAGVVSCGSFTINTNQVPL